MTNNVTIEELMEIKAKYVAKACAEFGKNEDTNEVLWYASNAIQQYNEIGNSVRIKEAIEQFYKTISTLRVRLLRVEA